MPARKKATAEAKAGSSNGKSSESKTPSSKTKPVKRLAKPKVKEDDGEVAPSSGKKIAKIQIEHCKS